MDDKVPQWPLKEASDDCGSFPNPNLLIPSPLNAATSETNPVHRTFEDIQHLNPSTPLCQTTLSNEETEPQRG